jgi:hypothetical protein
MDAIPHEFLMNYSVDLAPTTYAIGPTPRGVRATGGISGGRFEGPRLRGTMEPYGGDFAIRRPDDTLEADVHLVMRTDDAALIYLHYSGYIHPISEAVARAAQVGKDVYWRMVMRFETSAPNYEWLNRVIAIALGHFEGRSAVYRVYAIT